jgi:hypothetical protein
LAIQKPIGMAAITKYWRKRLVLCLLCGGDENHCAFDNAGIRSFVFIDTTIFTILKYHPGPSPHPPSQLA